MEERHDNSPSPSVSAGRPPSVTAMIAEAWRLTYGLKGLVLLRLMWIILVIVGVNIFFGVIAWIILALVGIPNFFLGVMATISYFRSDPASLAIMVILLYTYVFIINVITIYMAVPLIILGVRKAVNLSINMQLIKDQCSAVKNDLLIAISAYVVVSTILSVILEVFDKLSGIGAISLLIYIALSFLYLSVFVFAIPLIVIRKMGYADALQEGMNKLKHDWLVVFICMFLYSIIALLGITVIFIPWIITLYFTVIGVLFRDLYKLKIAEQKPHR